MRSPLSIAMLAAGALAVLVASSAPAAAPAPRKTKLLAYFATGFNDQAWQKEAHARILKAWKPTSLPAAGKKTVLITTIAKDGKITGARDHLLSGDAAWDKAAFDAVRNAGAFPPLPPSWPHDTLEVHWHFDSGN